MAQWSQNLHGRLPVVQPRFARRRTPCFVVSKFNRHGHQLCAHGLLFVPIHDGCEELWEPCAHLFLAGTVFWRFPCSPGYGLVGLLTGGVVPQRTRRRTLLWRAETGTLL